MEQPLYGVGEEIAPLALSEEEGVTCFEGGVKSLFCALTVRNQPLYESPAIVVWPLTAEQVQLSVQFARKHNLCIAVAGTGHDFQNRHSCKNDGFFIRTTLMKDMAYNEDGTLTLGPGLTFSEIHKFVASKGRIVSSGWATTVGIIGWSIGGGHGPFAPSLGKGVDNVVAATLVTADGELVEVNSTSNSDLLFALRGGGGSTWGIITSLTVNSYPLPSDGLTFVTGIMVSDLCEGLPLLSKTVSSYLDWSVSLDKSWGGLIWFVPFKDANNTCGTTVAAVTQYVYMGGQDDVFNKTWVPYSKLFNYNHSIRTVSNWWEVVKDRSLEPIIPIVSDKATYSGVPSVLVQRNFDAKDMEKAVMDHMQDCKNGGSCHNVQFYHDITGNIGSPQSKDDVSISKAFQTALYHVVSESIGFYTKFGNNSYFGESDYNLSNWQQQYWGENYDTLLSIKQKRDPDNVFWCRHCVGDTDE